MNSTTGLEPSSVLIRSTTSICTLPLQFAPLGKLRQQTPLLSPAHGRPASDLLARAQTADAPAPRIERADVDARRWRDRKSTRLNSSHSQISYAVFCLKKKKT